VTAFSPLNPTDLEADPIGRQDVDDSVDRRPVGGLGRGLAGILEQGPSNDISGPEPPSAGLDQLLGRQHPSKAATVRTFVVETALAAVAEAFGADGVVMTSRERQIHSPDDRLVRDDLFGAESEGTSPSLSLRLPPSWGPTSPALFAVYGNLWEMLTIERHHCSRCGISDQPLAYRQEKVDSYWAWFCRIDDQSVSLAAALVRAAPFDDEESDALARSMRSVASAVSPGGGRDVGAGWPAIPVATNIVVSADPDARDLSDAITAEVTVRNRPPGADRRHPGVSSLAVARRSRGSLASLTATGRGPDIETAVARAAANACLPQCRVRFAGSSDLDGNTVSVVIVSDATGAPRLGVAVRPVGDYSGVAEAVFLAASPGGIPSRR
jgi:hypothetical protein